MTLVVPPPSRTDALRHQREREPCAPSRRVEPTLIINSSVKWDEKEVPFHTVGRLTLLRKFTASAGRTGHSTPDSAPVGSINRARCPAEVASRKARSHAEGGCQR